MLWAPLDPYNDGSGTDHGVIWDLGLGTWDLARQSGAPRSQASVFLIPLQFPLETPRNLRTKGARLQTLYQHTQTGEFMTPVNIHLDQRLLPVQRATQLTRSLHHLRSKETIRWTWATTMKTPLPYFAPGEAESGKPADAFAFVPHDRVSNWEEIDVLILIAHGSDVSSRVFEYRNRNPNLLVLIWLWDNHVAQINNLRTVMAGDIYFPSHAYASGYLPNLLAPFGSHVPLCVAQWDPSEAALFLADSSGIPRSNQLLLNYVDYKFSWRTTLLEQIRNHLPEANNLLMPPEDRGRYFKKTKRERYFEWAEHKCTLILPVDQDLSTRVFDALVAGLVLVVPRSIPDFDRIIPRADQEKTELLK